MNDEQSMSKILRRMVYERKTIDLDGLPRDVTGGISEDEIMFIQSVIIERECRTCMETGVAYGVSTVAICEALSRLGGDCKHYGVDPCQYSEYNGAALAVLKECGLDHLFEHFDGPSHEMLPKLLDRSVRLDLALIDGWHTFDYTLLDVFYADKMLRPGGVLFIHDMDLPSKRKTWRFLKTHRRYRRIGNTAEKSKRKYLAEIFKGLFRARRSVVKKAALGLMDIDCLLAVEKVEDWEPNYDYFKDF